LKPARRFLRYSQVDLNDHSGLLGAPIPYGGVRGGDQNVWTVGINWYPNNALRFALDCPWIDVTPLDFNGANAGQNLNTLALRSQFSLYVRLTPGTTRIDRTACRRLGLRARVARA